MDFDPAVLGAARQETYDWVQARSSRATVAFMGGKLRLTRRPRRAGSRIKSGAGSRTGMPSFLGLVGEIAGDAGAGKDHDAGRQDLQHAAVAFEGRRLAVAGSRT